MINTLRPRQNGRHFADDVFKCIFLNENVWILLKISLKFVSMGPINNIPLLVQVMAWRWPGNKPLSEPMLVSLPTHICVTRPQWIEGAEAEYQSDAGSTKDTPYLVLPGELWGVFCEYLWENWLRYNGTTLYFILRKSTEIYYLPPTTVYLWRLESGFPA